MSLIKEDRFAEFCIQTFTNPDESYSVLYTRTIYGGGGGERLTDIDDYDDQETALHEHEKLVKYIREMYRL